MVFRSLDQDGTVVTVGSSATPIVLPDPKRKALYIWHMGATAVYLLPSPRVAAGQGIMFEADDNPIIWRADTDPEMTAYGWWGVTESEDVDLLVMEITG